MIHVLETYVVATQPMAPQKTKMANVSVCSWVPKNIYFQLFKSLSGTQKFLQTECPIKDGPKRDDNQAGHFSEATLLAIGAKR